MKFRRHIAACLLTLSMVLFAHAQTTDYHIGVGMKWPKDNPPEVIDMKWARQYMDDNATYTTNATRKDN